MYSWILKKTFAKKNATHLKNWKQENKENINEILQNLYKVQDVGKNQNC